MASLLKGLFGGAQPQAAPAAGNDGMFELDNFEQLAYIACACN
jgi:hypothetical protein